MVRELQAMPEAMQRAIRSVKVRTVRDAGDGTTEQVVDVKLWEKTRALKLAARAGMLTRAHRAAGEWPILSAMRDEHYDPFRRLPPPERPVEALVARLRGELTVQVAFPEWTDGGSGPFDARAAHRQRHEWPKRLIDLLPNHEAPRRSSGSNRCCQRSQSR